MCSEAAILKDPPKKPKPQYMLQVDFFITEVSYSYHY